MRNMTFLQVAKILDSTLAGGGLHVLVGMTGSGKSAICEILKKKGKSHPAIYDVQTSRDAEIYLNIVDDISTSKSHIIIDGYCAPSEIGNKVAESILNHVRGEYDGFGVLLVVQSIEDLTGFSFGVKTIFVIGNEFPRKPGKVFLKNFDVDESERIPFDGIGEYSKLVNSGAHELSIL